MAALRDGGCKELLGAAMRCLAGNVGQWLKKPSSPRPPPAAFAEAKAGAGCAVPCAGSPAEAACLSLPLAQALLNPGLTGWTGVLPLFAAWKVSV